MKILLAVDGSPYTKRMLAYLAAHDELLGTEREYTAITVVPAVPPKVDDFVSGQLLDEYYADEAREVLEPVLAFAAQKGWKVNAQTRVGRAGDVIAEAAASGNYDLVAMGSHGHTPVKSLVLGSVTQRVLSQCETPLLIVR